MILFKEGREVNKLLGSMSREEIEGHLRAII
jgi:hypothetical protein